MILHGLLASDRVTGELAERHKIEIREFAEKAMSEFVEEPRRLRPDRQPLSKSGFLKQGSSLLSSVKIRILLLLEHMGALGFGGP